MQSKTDYGHWMVNDIVFVYKCGPLYGYDMRDLETRL